MKQNICKSFLNYFSLIFFLVAFLTACGGGSDDGSPDVGSLNDKLKINLPATQNAEGLWYGNYTTPDGETYSAQGLMYDGGFVLMNVGDGIRFYIGDYTTIINNISLSSSKYIFDAGDNSSKGVEYLDGVVYSKGTMLLDTLEGGQYSLTYSYQQTEKPISIEILEGSLSTFFDDSLIKLIVDSSGNIINDDSFNCDFSGDISIPDNQENIFLMDVVISGDNCLHRGVYSGFGNIHASDDVENIFLGYFHNGTYGFLAVNKLNEWLGL